MYLVTEFGDKVHLDDNNLSEDITRFRFADVKLVSDDTELEKCWVAMVNTRDLSKKEYEFVGEKVYDHYPTQEELVWLMAQYDALWSGYVTVDEAWRYKEKYD